MPEAITSKHQNAVMAEASREFIELIQQYIKAGGQTPLIRKALSAFVVDHPHWYQHTVGRALKLKQFEPSELKVKEGDLHHNIEQFSERLVTHPFKTFILNDAKIFLGGSSVMDEDYFIYRLSRSSLGTTENYYAIFQLANHAALKAQGNWEKFREEYHQGFLALLRHNPKIRAVALSIGEEARLLMQKQRSTKIIDTGPQGTFALFLMEALHLRMSDVETDVMLFSIYPWLAELFDGRYQTVDASYMYVIERNLARMQHSMDPLEKTSGALVGFAVGDALGAPAVGILKDDFLHLKGSDIRHFTTNPSHPYFFNLSVGQTTDQTRMLTGVADDIVVHRGYDRASRVRCLSEWATHCQNDPGFARWPGTTTFHSAIQMARGVSTQKRNYTDTHSWGAVPRSLVLGLLYTNDKELLRIAREEIMLTHCSWESISGAAYVAVLTSYLVADHNPYSAAERALQTLMSEYGKHVPRSFIQAVRLAIRTTIEPHEAPALFGTGTPVEECIPLALYYFLRYPSHFRTPVQLGANSFRVDSSAEVRRMRDYRWSEQVLYCHGGNTGGIAAMVGALVGAHNGLKIIDEQFVAVEDFDHLVRLGRQIETLRLKRIAGKTRSTV